MDEKLRTKVKVLQHGRLDANSFFNTTLNTNKNHQYF